MTLKSSLHAFIALATVASLATACQEDESEQLARSNKAISFNIVKSWEQDVTRSASLWTPNKAEYMGCDTLVSDDKQDTLYLERTISDLTTESTSVWTRANILTASNLTAFKVSCVKRNTSTSATTYYFQDETTSLSGSIYSTTNTYYWLETGKENYDFYAYAPSDFTGVTNPTPAGAPTFTYDATDGDNCDLMVAMQTEPDTYKESVPLSFDHLLSGIRFIVDGDCAKIKIKEIKIEGLNWSGKCNYNSSTEKWTWSNLATNASQSIAREFSPTPFDTSTDKIIDKLDGSNPKEASFFVVPQIIPAEAKIYLTYTADTGEKTLSASIRGTLAQGKLTTYTLKVEDFDFSVEQEGLHLKLTFTKGASQINDLELTSITFKGDDVELISDQSFYGEGDKPSYNKLAGAGTEYYYDGSFFIANAVDRYNDKYSSDYCWDSSKSIAENKDVKTQTYTVTLTNTTTGVSHSVDVSFHFDYFEYVYDNTSTKATAAASFLYDSSGNFTMQDVTASKWRNNNSGGGKYSDETIKKNGDLRYQTIADLSGEHTIRVYISNLDVNAIGINNSYFDSECQKRHKSLIKINTPLPKSSSGQIGLPLAAFTEVPANLMAKQGNGLEDLSYCFYGCSNLKSLDASSWDTSKVTTMQSMFYNCSGLTSLDVSKFNTENVTNMASMFYRCKSLTSLNVTNFDTKKVTTMASMFSGCSGLTGLDVTNFDTEKVTTMASMFNGCSGLTGLDVTKFDTENVTTMASMFNGCSGLTGLDVTQFDTGNVTNMSSMFYGCSGLLSSNFDVTKFNTLSVKNMESMFYGCKSLTSLDVTKFKTENVTTMANMFMYCSGLTSLDVTKFDTKNVTTMGSMFQGCSKLTSIDLKSFNTVNVTNMGSMFQGSGLKELDFTKFPNFTTKNVMYMWYMFYGCPLSSIDVSSFNTESLERMEYMFCNCSKLTTLDLSNFDTSKVTFMKSLFQNCSGLTSLTLGSNWNTSSVKLMDYMFSGCSGLTNLDLSNFVTSSVTTMESMFQGCSGLTSLDVRKFDISEGTKVTSMFSGLNWNCNITCTSAFQTWAKNNATTIKLSEHHKDNAGSPYWNIVTVP